MMDQEGDVSAMIDGGAGPIVAKVGIAIIQRAAPAGLALVRSWLAGKTLVIVGQSRAGKTTFLDYLHYGLFAEAQESPKTLEAERSARFDVAIGRDAALEMVIKTAVDLPGQIGSIAHADTVCATRPHAIIVILDLTKPLTGVSEEASSVWLTDFLRRLENQWRARGRHRNRLQTFIVVLNKKDAVDERTVRAYKTSIRKILDQEFREARGKMTSEVRILPCISVTTPTGTALIDRVISQLAKDLARK